MRQNLHSIELSLKGFYTDFGGYPVSLYSDKGLVYEGYMTRFPRNELKRSDFERENASDAAKYLDSVADRRILSLIGATRQNSTLAKFGLNIDSLVKSNIAELWNLSEDDEDEAEIIDTITPRPTDRFSKGKWFMGNLCFGFELGCDIVSWWDIYPADRKRDREDKNRRLQRVFAEGNFIYLPLNESNEPIYYDIERSGFLNVFSEGTGVTEKVLAPNYAIFLFGRADYPGLDVWTPTGNPNMPVSLKPDGIPDGVDLVLSSIVDE